MQRLPRGSDQYNQVVGDAVVAVERKIAQLKTENERLMDGIQDIITTFYPVMYDDNKVGLALVALLNDAIKEGGDERKFVPTPEPEPVEPDWTGPQGR